MTQPYVLWGRYEGDDWLTGDENHVPKSAFCGYFLFQTFAFEATVKADSCGHGSASG